MITTLVCAAEVHPYICIYSPPTLCAYGTGATAPYKVRGGEINTLPIKGWLPPEY